MSHDHLHRVMKISKRAASAAEQTYMLYDGLDHLAGSQEQIEERARLAEKWLAYTFSTLFEALSVLHEVMPRVREP